VGIRWLTDFLSGGGGEGRAVQQGGQGGGGACSRLLCNKVSVLYCKGEEERVELHGRMTQEVEEHALVCCAARWVCCTLDAIKVLLICKVLYYLIARLCVRETVSRKH